MMLVPYFFNKSRLALQIFVVFSLIFYEMVSTNVIPSVQLPKNITSIMPRIARSAYNSLHPIVYLLRTNISDVNAQINTRQSEHGYFLAPSKPAEAFIGPAYDGITECKAVCITVLIVLASIFLLYFYCCITGPGSTWRGITIIHKLNVHALLVAFISAALTATIFFSVRQDWDHSNQWTCTRSIETSMTCYLAYKGIINLFLVDRLYALDPRGPRCGNAYYVWGLISVIGAHALVSAVIRVTYVADVSGPDSQCVGGMKWSLLLLYCDLVIKLALIFGTYCNLAEVSRGVGMRGLIKILHWSHPICYHSIRCRADRLRLRLGQSIWGMAALILMTATVVAVNTNSDGHVPVLLFIILCTIDFLWSTPIAIRLSLEEALLSAPPRDIPDLLPPPPPPPPPPPSPQPDHGIQLAHAPPPANQQQDMPRPPRDQETEPTHREQQTNHPPERATEPEAGNA